ncbi:S-Ena type endospore appendage [Alicyclobacillus fastidiosus]|uniref:S-Ena type endospore appendage n=1 Tax=Alicyclobacillus fastidiosus TaxID=392011 RepID=UPI0034DDA086
MAQISKRVTVVNVHCGQSRKRRRCIPRKKKPKAKRFCWETICGRIFQLCSDEARTYFLSTHPYPAAMVRVDNDSKCAMTVFIQLNGKEEVIAQIEQGQQVSFNVASLKSLRVECCGESGVCKGAYLIRVRQFER